MTQIDPKLVTNPAYDQGKEIDIDQFVGHLDNALQFLKQGPDRGAIDNTSADPMSSITDQAPPKPMATTSGTATARGGGLEDGGYDGFGVSQEFGVNGHPGIDIAVPVGTKLIAPISGTVTHAGNDDPGGYGAWVEITSTDGTVIRYGHLSSVGVSNGDQVSPGTLLGLSGGAQGAEGSGNASGPHLHFEVHSSAGGPAVDPSSYLAGGWQILGAD